MSILKRFTHLLKAEAHGVIDILEDPHETLKQAIREMEEAMQERERELQGYEAERAAAREQHSQLSKELERVNEQIGVCLDTNNEDLARSAMRKRLGITKASQLIEERAKDLTGLCAKGSESLARDKERLQAIRDKAKLFAAPLTSGTHAANPLREDFITEHEVELALLEEKQRRANSIDPR